MATRAKPRGIAGAVLGRWREEKREMICYFTEEAVAAAWAILATPHQQWPKENHYECADTQAVRDVEKLYRRVEKNCVGPRHTISSEFTKELAGMLKAAYDQNMPESHKVNLWNKAQEVLARKFIEGPVSIPKREAERLKEMVDYYLKLKVKPNQLTLTHFGALLSALSGDKPDALADEKEDEVALEAAKKEWADAHPENPDKK